MIYFRTLSSTRLFSQLVLTFYCFLRPVTYKRLISGTQLSSYLNLEPAIFREKRRMGHKYFSVFWGLTKLATGKDNRLVSLSSLIFEVKTTSELKLQQGTHLSSTVTAIEMQMINPWRVISLCFSAPIPWLHWASVSHARSRVSRPHW